MVIVSSLFLASSALRNLSTRNIQNVDLNHVMMTFEESEPGSGVYECMLNNAFAENPNIVSVTNVTPILKQIKGDPFDSDKGCFQNCVNLTTGTFVHEDTI